MSTLHQPGVSVSPLKFAFDLRRVVAQHLQDRLDAAAALGPAVAGRIDLTWPLAVHRHDRLFDSLVGQRIADADIHDGPFTRSREICPNPRCEWFATRDCTQSGDRCDNPWRARTHLVPVLRGSTGKGMIPGLDILALIRRHKAAMHALHVG